MTQFNHSHIHNEPVRPEFPDYISVSYDYGLIKKNQVHAHLQVVLSGQLFSKIEKDCNSFSSFVKNLFQIFGPRKAIEYFVDFEEIALRLKQFSLNFVEYL